MQFQNLNMDPRAQSSYTLTGSISTQLNENIWIY